jgi:hypothetical protein
MNDTEQLFLAAAAWALIAAAIARFIPNWPGRIVFFALAVGIPFWELPYGYYNFQKLCREETTLKVIEKFPPQDSVCIEYFDAGLYRQLAQGGFTRIEITGRSDNAKEYAAKGQVFMTNHEQAKSSYCIAFENNISLPWRLLRADTMIEQRSDRRVIGRQSEFYWTGMWWQEQARPAAGRGGVCSKDSNETIALLRRGSG